MIRPTRSLKPFVACLLLVMAIARPVSASSPRLNMVLPRGVQCGAEHEITFSGERLQDSREIFFYSPGFEVLKIEAADKGGRAVRARVKVAGDCRLGEHVVQLRTESGISDFRTLYVGRFAAVADREPNNDFGAPQAIPLNVTVDGVIQTEDVDYFLVQAKKGQRLSVEIEALRLGDALFDPYVAILDQRRFELAFADDTPLLGQDAAISLIAKEDGPYVIQVREAAYGGNANCHYRLHVGTFPRPTAVFPAGGKLGEEIEVRFLGDPLGPLVQKLRLPSQPDAEFGLFAKDGDIVAPSPNPFRLAEQANVIEKEPNNDPANATPAEVPRALNGIIETPGDVDCFRFSSKKGQVWEVECYARRVRSPLDPVMSIIAANGSIVASDDDARRPDSYIRFTAPSDGDYSLRVTDHLGRGASDFVYRVEFAPVQAALSLGIPRVEQYGQYRQTVFVPRGNRFGTVMSVSRTNCSGELVLDGLGLPTGLTMIAEPIAGNATQIPVVFEASAEAPLNGKLVDFTAHLTDPKLSVRGGFTNTADFVIGPPNQSIYRTRTVNRLAMAVVEEVPFQLEIVQPKVPIVRDGSMQLKIVAQRKEGFRAPIRVELPFRPPNIGATTAVEIPEGKNEVAFPLSAAGNAPIGKWKVFVLGSAEVGGSAWAASRCVTLEIAEPHVRVAMQRTSCEQGQETQVYCKLNPTSPFDGKGRAQLLGLPTKATASELEFTKDTSELVFAVKTDPATPVGKHGNVVCQITIARNDETIVSIAGKTELQIDKPLPAPASAPPVAQPVAATPPPKPKETPAAKPMSRLEKLRLSSKERVRDGAVSDNKPK